VSSWAVTLAIRGVLDEGDPLPGEEGGRRFRATHLELSEMGAFRNNVEDGILHGDAELCCMSAVPLDSDGPH